MKTTLLKISSFFMYMFIMAVMLCNSYMLYLTVRMSNGGFLDNVSVMADHKVFSRMPIASTSLIATIILLAIFVRNLIKTHNYDNK